MNAERYRTASAIFHAALEVAADRRAAFLASACGDDHELRHEVDTLLSAHRDAGSFLGRPALEVAATVAAGPAFAPGSTIGVYEVRALLGVGGMGEVYRATDSRLHRDVALKVLPHRFRFDAERRARFEREAQVLASLNHPNIATLLGIEDADGVQALVMEHVEGDPLDHRIGMPRERVAGGPLAPEEALAIAAQLVDALEFAHGRGIVHRDLKPANIKIRPDGTVKVLDFGLAKAFGLDSVAGVNDATITVADAGLVLGTPSYMSPEQARGGAVDSRSDVWAFGCVLFEMLTGQRAFGGDSTAAVIAAILERDPDFATLPPNTPPSIRRLLERTLARNPADRLRHIGDARLEIQEARSATDARTSPSSSNDAASHPAVATAPPRPVWTSGRLAIAVLLVVATTLGAVAWKRASDQRWARTVAIPEVASLVEAGDFSAAFALADKADDYVADDPMLRSLAPQFTMTVTITSTPPGAKVYVRGYDATGAQWQYLGLTPLEKVSLPRETMRWSLKKDGFEETELATMSSVDLVTAILDRVGQRPAEMVRVPGVPEKLGSVRLVNGAQLERPVPIPPFLLDRFEVTNKDFKEFVDADGYAQPSFWDGLDFSRNGVARSWTDAVKEFVDSTGKPGPKTWEFGNYAKGHDDYPVTGVSWYEAMAYARFRDKTLPTIYHWANAAVSDTEGSVGLSPWIVPLSNYSGMGSSPVRTYQGMSPFGTFDMAGNVREWILNQEQRARQPVAIGGSWRDPDYIFTFAKALDPSDRSDVNGFRLMRQIEGEPRAVKLEEPFLLPGRSYVGEQPVPDDIFAAYAGQYEYQRGDLRASSAEIVETTSEWRKERVEIDTGYGDRMEVYLFVPINGRPPFQPLIYFPLVNAFFPNMKSRAIQPGSPILPLDFIVKSGRVLVQPVYKGSYERCCVSYLKKTSFARATFDRRWDISRTLDYLESRPDEFDMKHAGLIGTSSGPWMALPYLALEHRFQAAVFLSGGLPQLPQGQLAPQVDPLNFATRVTLPVLMINGRYDQLAPKASGQETLFRLLGTPQAKKRYCVVEAGHGDIPRTVLLRETLGWLDYYLGDPDRPAKDGARLRPPGGETCASP